MPDFHIVRYSTPALYTFELVVVLAVWVVVLALWRAGDRRSLAAYVIGGLYNSGIELLAQGSGVRTILDVRLFGVLPVGYPLLPLILGFFEGGVLLLTGFEILRGLRERDRRALRVGIGITAGLLALIIPGALQMRAQLAADPQSLALTTRGLLRPGSIAILAACYSVGLGYAFLASPTPRRDRRGLLGWYAIIAAVAVTWYTPAFLTGGRSIGTLQNGTYTLVSLPEQIAVLYGYSIVFEAAGFYLPVYVILRLCRLL